MRELGDQSPSEHANVIPVATIPRKRTKYPVISWVRAGDWAESPDNFQPGDADEWLESEEKAGPHGYWLVVDGDSMMPLFPQGSRILVQPEGFDLISGKFYVAIYYEPGKNRDTTVKQYVRDVGFEYLKPLNPTYRTLEVGENVRIVGRVIDYKLPPGVL
ncbi:putative HTH-type transcriptional regulator [compost metagenome]